MNRTKHDYIDGEILTLENAAKRLNLGLTTTKKKAKECGAMLKLGRSVRVDISKLSDYLKSNFQMAQEKPQEKPQRESNAKRVWSKQNITTSRNIVTSIRINEEILEDIRAYAEAEGVTQTYFMNGLLIKALELYTQETKEADE